MSSQLDYSSRILPKSLEVYVSRGEIPLVIPLDGMELFDDIKNYLINAGVDMERKVLVNDNDDIMPYQSSLQLKLPDTGLAVKMQIGLAVQHSSLCWIVPTLLNSKMTIRDIKVRRN
jgi:hypothetical protein